MTSRERIQAVLNFEKPDRLPVIEWAFYWDKTVERWHSEGLPTSLTDPEDVREYFGLDRVIHTWVRSFTKDVPWPKQHGAPMIRNEQEYEEFKKYLYPSPAVEPAELERIADAQEDGAAYWFTFEGFFWHPRSLFGIEPHLYAFHDEPELMNRINEDNLEFLVRLTEEICAYARPQFMSFAEDMSYNHGSMISKSLFEEFNAPFYRRAVPFLKSKGIKVFVDSDGLVDDPIDWYAEVGCEGFLPLEKQAGVDLLKYRRKHPRFLFMGGFDKLSMNGGEAALRQEFERLLPVMKQGGYIPGVDHQTPPEVSLEDYRLYVKLLREYVVKAVE